MSFKLKLLNIFYVGNNFYLNERLRYNNNGKIMLILIIVIIKLIFNEVYVND